MQTKNLIAGLLLASPFVSQPAWAQFTLIDDLTTHSAGNLTGQTATSSGTWQGVGVAGSVTIGTSSTTGGNAAIVGGTDGASFLALPTPFGSTSTSATFFMKFDLGSSQAANNVNWDLANSVGGDAGGPLNNVELNINVPARAGITSRNGGAFDEMSADGVNVFVPANNTVYSLWWVVNTSAHTYQIYMQGGALASQTLMSVGTGAFSATPTTFTTTSGFRSTTTPLVDFVYGAGGTGDTGAQSLYSIYEDPNGQNLLDPTVVPEPGTVALLTLSGAALLWRRRQSR